MKIPGIFLEKHHPSMVTIINLSAAPNRLVGPQTVAPKAVFDTFIFEGGGDGSKNP